MHRIFTTSFSSVYPHYVNKVERKGRTKAELDEVIEWLTGYDEIALKSHLESETTFEKFFADAELNPNVSLITGVVCGVRVEEVEDPLMQKIRYLDKLVDEVAKGRPLTKVLRTPAGRIARSKKPTTIFVTRGTFLPTKRGESAMGKRASRSSSLIRIRAMLVALVGVTAFVGASCAPPPTTFNFGPFTVPLPSIGAEATPVNYEIEIPGIPPVELTPYIPPIELTPYIPPVELTPYIPEVCIPFIGCTPAVPATYSPAIPATYSPEVPATYSPAIPGGTCNAGYTPPAFYINDITADIPLVSLDVSAAKVTIPNVKVNIPAATMSVGSANVGCSIAGLPAVNLPTGEISISFPAQAVVQDASLDIATGVLTLSNPSFSVTGVSLHFAGLDADFSLPDITIPLPTINVPLT